jgi:hypothetical protein
LIALQPNLRSHRYFHGLRADDLSTECIVFRAKKM